MKNYYQLTVNDGLQTLPNTLRNAKNGCILQSLCLVFLFCSIHFFSTAAGTNDTNQKNNSLTDKYLVICRESVDENDFISLFNGKDLTGWCYRTKVSENIVTEPFEGKTESKDGRYMAKDSLLTINPWDEVKGPHWVNLWTLKEFTGDFIMTLEFRASVNADSGIFLRGKQLQCRDYLVAGPYKELKNYKPQDWNKIEVVVKNNIAHCTCNGEILEYALPIPATGSIGLEADRGRMDYRNILIKEL